MYRMTLALGKRARWAEARRELARLDMHHVEAPFVWTLRIGDEPFWMAEGEDEPTAQALEDLRRRLGEDLALVERAWSATRLEDWAPFESKRAARRGRTARVAWLEVPAIDRYEAGEADTSDLHDALMRLIFTRCQCDTEHRGVRRTEHRGVRGVLAAAGIRLSERTG